MIYDLPTSLDVCGLSYEIRSDYRAVLDVCAALSDADLSDQDKGLVTLDIFYPAFSGYTVESDGTEEAILMPPEHYEEAIKRCFWFVSCGDENQNRKAPKLMDWEKDFKYIVAPVNRVVGQEVRAAQYMHWWTFIGAYYEIGGDCTFAQIVRIRDLLNRGKKLDKQDREWYVKNRGLVDMKSSYSEKEKAVLGAWGV
jgi:hypothetical protein